MADIAAIIKQATPRQRTVTVCTAGDVVGRLDELQEELSKVAEDWEPESIADQHPGRAIAAEIKELQAKSRESEVPFTLRYIGERAYSDLLAAHPSDRDDEAFGESFTAALIASSCVDPVMTEEQAHELFEVINQGEVKKLFDAAWDVHNSADATPFSLLASALMAGLGDEK